MAPGFGEVEEYLHLGSIAVVGHSSDGDKGIAYREQGEVGAREGHGGGRRGTTESLALKSPRNNLRLLHGCLA